MGKPKSVTAISAVRGSVVPKSLRRTSMGYVLLYVCAICLMTSSYTGSVSESPDLETKYTNQRKGKKRQREKRNKKKQKILVR